MRLLMAVMTTVCVVAGRAEAQGPSENAALRYWMAFALLADAPADAEMASLVQRVAAGDAPWDEPRLGGVIDANLEALEIMRRGTNLPSCDWGVEYDLGPSVPIAHLAKARVLGRLNLLLGRRFAARGDMNAAVDRWLAGVRFSRHVARGGTLISLLSANAVLLPTLNALTAAATSGQISDEGRAQVDATVGALPETGFDWAAAMMREGEVLEVGVRTNAVSDLSERDLDELRSTVARIADAMRLPPEQARSALGAISLGTLPLASPGRINDTRESIQSARRQALAAVGR